MGFIDTMDETKADLRVDEGDHERFAHYVNKEDMLEAYVNGKPVVALCGKIWVPSKDPEKFPICPACKEIHAQIFGI